MSESAKFAKIAYHALADKKGENIKIIDISGVSPIADYFIIADGANQNQLQAMRDAVEEELYAAGCQLRQTEGNRNSTWILMDYGDVIVHMFSREDRLFYDLERIWTDGVEVEVENL
jgi:ribosome-associated protein